MEDTYMSSKGQVVIPKVVRDAMGLKQGSRLKVEVIDGKIVLSQMPVVRVDDLYGCVQGFSLTADLEREHLLEVEKDEPRKRGKRP